VVPAAKAGVELPAISPHAIRAVMSTATDLIFIVIPAFYGSAELVLPGDGQSKTAPFPGEIPITTRFFLGPLSDSNRRPPLYKSGALAN
jgi:hypothetical protein